MNPWDLIAMQPMINVLIVLSQYLFNSFGLAIITLTIVIRAAMYPLTLKQTRASKAMQELQPKLAELQKKYARDKEKLAKEQAKLFKESGISPMGCVVPMLIQMPIWLALFWSVRNILAVTPEELLSLSRYLYPWPIVYSAVPLSNSFLWLNLAVGDMILAILVGGTMWVQQKMMMSSSADPKQQAQSQMMLWMMPLMFAFLTMSLPSGLALYWLTSNVITIGMQYFVTGWGGLVKSTATKPSGRDKKYKRRITQVEQASPADADIGADIVEPDFGQKSSGYPTQSRSISIRRQPKKGKGRRHKGK